MGIITAIPLFIYLWFAINGVLILGEPGALAGGVFSLGLVSGATWTATLGDLFVGLGLLALYVELFKSTRTTAKSVIDHTLSLLVFVAFLVEFLVFARAGNSTFVILGLMSLLDVIAGFTITIFAARRDMAFGDEANIR